MATHTQSFWTKYIFSQDHKVIGAQYLIVGLIMAAVAGFFAYVFRYHLAYPDAEIPLWGTLDPRTYNMLVTTHGALMIFWVAMPILVAAIGNFLIPTMLGTDDMAFPFLNMLSFWVFFLSAVVVVASLFVPGGGFDGGWTLYPPLSADAYLNTTPDFWKALFSGGSLVILALALEFASMLMGGINFMVTTINKRARGMSFSRMPILVWFMNFSVVTFMFSVGPVIAGALMLLLDRVAGTGFYDAYRGGDPILFQHLFWFFGHPEVYVLLFPTLGVMGEIIPTFARKPLFGYKFIIWASIVAIILSMVVWAHHQFVAGINPYMAVFFSVGTILISIPFAGIILSYVATIFGGNIRLELPMWWAVGFLATFLIGGLTGLYLGSNTFDIYAHDTSFVVAHFHYTLFPITFFGFFAAFYYWFPKFTGRMYNDFLGKLHFWGTFIFFQLFALPIFFLGLNGQPRRMADYTAFETLMQDWHIQFREIATISAILLILTQFIWLYNFIVSLWKGKRVSSDNPWQANTLEWQAPSPPPHGNFEVYPEVYRDPYTFGVVQVNGTKKDFIPQNEKLPS